MKIQTLISEARRNPTQNPKLSVNQAIIDRYNKAGWKVAKYTFVSFTAIDKLGVNPQSEYNTPLGIYAYPISYVKDTIGKGGPTTKLPFAGDMPYVNIFSVKPTGVVMLDDVSEAELDRYMDRLRELVQSELQRGQPDLSTTDAKKRSFTEMQTIYREAGEDEDVNEESAGNLLWNYVRFAAKLFFAPRWNTTQSRAWNTLFRKIGINGCVDWDGHGIIHPSEPTQAVFFSSSVLTDIERLRNGFSPIEQQKRADFATMTDDQIQALVNDPKFAEWDVEHISNPDVFIKIADAAPQVYNHMWKLPLRVLRAVLLKKGLPFILDSIAQHRKLHSSSTDNLEWMLSKFGKTIAQAYADVGFRGLAVWEVELLIDRYPEYAPATAVETVDP